MMRLAYTGDDDLTVSVRFDRWDSGDPMRAQWEWSIDCGGENIATASDLRSGATGRANAVDALASLGSFLTAWAESETGENADLFPASMRALACDWQGFVYEMVEALGRIDD